LYPEDNGSGSETDFSENTSDKPADAVVYAFGAAGAAITIEG